MNNVTTNGLDPKRNLRFVPRAAASIALCAALLIAAACDPMGASKSAAKPQAAAPTKLTVQVADEAGAPIPNAAATLIVGKPGDAHRDWATQAVDESGAAKFNLAAYAGDTAAPIEIVAQAPGHAAAVVAVDLAKLAEPLKVVLTTGKGIAIAVTDAAGAPVSDKIELTGFYAPYALPAWDAVAGQATFTAAALPKAPVVPVVNPDNITDFVPVPAAPAAVPAAPESTTPAVARPHLNFTPTTRGAANTFEARIAEGAKDLYILVDQPGLIRGFQAGPFNIADWANGPIQIALPAAGSLMAMFEGAGEDPAQAVPFYRSGMQLARRLKLPSAEEARIPIQLTTGKGAELSLRATDLAPGDYEVESFTGSVEQRADTRRPGYYRETMRVAVKTGETAEADFAYSIADDGAWRGKSDYTITLKRPDGAPAAGVKLGLIFHSMTSAARVIQEQVTDAAGKATFKGLTTNEAGGDNRSAFEAVVGEIILGQFTVTKPAESREFIMPPMIGDLAPDIVVASVRNGAEIRLSQLRGRPVYLEFWATWCGPCQEPMQELNNVWRSNGNFWREKVAILAVSIDQDPETVVKHQAKVGWSALEFVWAHKGEPGFTADAPRAFGVEGVPSAFIIDAEGKIVWKGHPAALNLEAKLKELAGDKGQLPL